MKKIIRFLTPNKQWQFPVIVLLGAMAGLSLFALIESEALSYLSDDPKACVNCHIMTPSYVTWNTSSHRQVATCNDCHLPHDNILRTYLFKAKDGLYHASVFTARTEPEVIRIRESRAEVVQSNCIRCHQDQVTDIRLSAVVESHIEKRTARQCWECHQEVPHGKVRSLSSSEYYGKLPLEHPKTLPEWLKKTISKSDK